MIESWYLTVTAVREFQEICGLDPVSDGPQFDRCAVELEKACEEAVLKKVEEHRQIWHAKPIIRGIPHRIEIYVSTKKREEGEAYQVVRVRSKSRGRRKK